MYPGSIYKKINRTVITQTTTEQYEYAWTTRVPYNLKPSIRKHEKKKPFFHKIRRAFRLMRDNLEEFTTSSTLHGFRYLFNKKYARAERICWWIVVILSAITCAIYIEQIIEKRNKSPVVLQYSEFSSSIWEIPFPAVTLCNEAKLRQSSFNYSKAYFERWSDPPSISQDDLKLYHDALLVCKNENSDGPDYTDKNSIETLRTLAPTYEQTFFDCLWGNYSCDQMFYHTLTKDGYCFTFNMLSAEELFRMENLNKDYRYAYGPNKSTGWTLKNGYTLNTPVNTYPLRGLSYTGVEFEVILLANRPDLDPMCQGPIQGFKIWLHNPAELPNINDNYLRLPITYQLAAAIKPKIVISSRAVRSYPPSKRKCYFPDERYLRYFRTYTQRNCDLECAANFTVKQCGCVPPHMPHSPSTKVCGGGKAKCIAKATETLSVRKSMLGTVDDGKQSQDCGCLQGCMELEYDAVTSHAHYDLKIFAANHPEIAERGRLPSGLIIYFEDLMYTSIQRREHYSFEAFLGQCGNLLSLFLGFSFLSLIEIFFFFTFRLWNRMRARVVAEKNLQPHPFPWVL